MVVSGNNKRACHSDVTTEGSAFDCLFEWAWASPLNRAHMWAPHEWCQSVTPYCKSDLWNIMCNIKLHTWHHTDVVRTCTRWHMVQWWKKCVNRERPWEGIKRAEDKNQRATNKTRKEGLKGYAGMVPTMFHYKLPTTIVTLLIGS